MLDRQGQRAVLERLQAVYPERIDFNLNVDDVEVEPIDAATLAYLEEHGLVKASFISTSDRNSRTATSARITAKGIDFLAEDGGLGAILSVVTVRLHADTIRDLLKAQIEKSSAPEAEKKSLLQSLKNLPAKGLETLTTELIKSGLTHHTDIVHWLHGFLS